jgi:hypothetical protein
MSVLINASTSTGLVQSADTSGEIELQSNGTTALKVNTNEGIQILNCLGVGNATPSTSGSGITFPATASASTNANTLDDYEEGTWAPIISNGYTSPTYSLQSGTYTKIGRQVNFALQMNVNGGTRTGSGLQITLPFTSAASTGSRAFGGYWTYADATVLGSATTNVPFIYIPNASSIMQFYSAVGATFLGTDLTTATPEFYICGQYITE